MTVSRFQKRVYDVLRKIPRGRVTTYKAVAERLGVKCYRAVGSACNKNPFSPKVPCHRVVCRDGTVGGFNSGVKKKIGFLSKEGVLVKKGKIVDFEKINYRL